MPATLSATPQRTVISLLVVVQLLLSCSTAQQTPEPASVAPVTSAPIQSAGETQPPASGSPAAQPTPPPPSPAPPSPSPSPSPTEFNGSEWARDGRLNVVLFGSDEGPGRWSLRTDATFLLSVDVETARAALFGFPRYMSNIPLPPESAQHYPDGRLPRYLNAIYREAQDRPKRFPGNDELGLKVVADAVGELAGVDVDHYVVVNLNGFVDLVDALGGLWIDVPERVYDARYAREDGVRKIRIDIKPGCQLLDGRHALAYARSRHQDGDYARLGRELITLAAMRRQYDPLAMLPRLPQLFDIAGKNFSWTLVDEDVRSIAQLAVRVDVDRMHQVLFIPPEYRRTLPGDTVERIRAKVGGIFDEPEPTPSPGADQEPCPPPE
ncbi:MAG: LCP family protein [Chloroflexota bacterium]|nr:LCP family protein [Chloroflexota bacterium]